MSLRTSINDLSRDLSEFATSLESRLVQLKYSSAHPSTVDACTYKRCLNDLDSRVKKVDGELDRCEVVVNNSDATANALVHEAQVAHARLKVLHDSGIYSLEKGKETRVGFISGFLTPSMKLMKMMGKYGDSGSLKYSRDAAYTKVPSPAFSDALLQQEVAMQEDDGRPVTGIQRIGGARVPRHGIIGPDGEIVKRAPLDPAESKALWKRAIKLPMYSVGIAPVLLSATAAFVYTGAFQPLKTLGLCIASAAIIAWLNLSNDVFDCATGVDKNKAESVVNLTGDWRKVFLIANAFFILGVGILFSIIAQVPNEFVTKALYAAICCGYLYQGPPFRWSYLGLGEPLCFLAFGPLATNAFYLAQIPAALAIPEAGASVFSVIPSSMWALSTFLGLSTTIILFCSHFHQIEETRQQENNLPWSEWALRNPPLLSSSWWGACTQSCWYYAYSEYYHCDMDIGHDIVWLCRRDG
eukprot:jgi/Picre1/34475/NNA_001943.t1